jgi:serine/threonine-protein phosphatase 2B catalytic subunit
LLNLKDNITVIGDIHGQYYDFVKMLDLLPDLSNCKYLFLGDYVDRGEFSIECLILIYCLKASYPDKVFLLRGNHESRQLTAFFNFRTECMEIE